MVMPAPVMMVISVIMRMFVSVRMARIGTAHRMEWLGYHMNMGAKALKHSFDHMIVQDKHAMRLNLRGEMAVADMPAKFAQMLRICRKRFDELLFPGNHFGKPTIGKHQRIAMIKRNRRFKVDQHGIAMLKRQHLSPQMALVMGKNNDIPCRTHPFAVTQDRFATQQSHSPFLLPGFCR